MQILENHEVDQFWSKETCCCWPCVTIKTALKISRASLGNQNLHCTSMGSNLLLIRASISGESSEGDSGLGCLFGLKLIGLLNTEAWMRPRSSPMTAFSTKWRTLINLKLAAQ
jgi:hypothetical protein